MNEKETQNQMRFVLGLFLALQGINMMAVGKVIVGQNLRILTPIVLLMTLLCIIDWNNKDNLRVSVLSLNKAIIVFYLGLITAISLISDYPITQPTYGFLYQTVYLCTIIALWNHSYLNDERRALIVLFYLSGILCLIALILILKNYSATSDIFFQGLGKETDGTIIITRATTGSISAVLFATVLAISPNNKEERLLRLLFLFIALFVMFVSRRRTVYVFFAVMLLFWLFQRSRGLYQIRKETLYRFIFVVGLFIVLLFILLSYSGTRAIIDHGVNSLVKGITTYVGKTTDDTAALLRHERLIRVPHKILHESSIFEFLFGFGYMTEWLDIPVLQAFLDLGLFGGILYALITLVFPVRYLVRKTDNQLMILVQLLYLCQIIACFSSGLPYGSSFFPLALLYYVAESDKTEERVYEQY